MKKLLVFSGNPTQYHSPLFRKINELNFFSMEVLFGDKIGAEPFYNEEFAAKIQWDVPVLDGYKYKFFKNHSSSQKKGFFSRNNPGIILSFKAENIFRFKPTFSLHPHFLSNYINTIILKPSIFKHFLSV